MLVCGVEVDMEVLYQKYKNEQVKAIREVRSLSGAGLKEAKDAVDAFWAQKAGMLSENKENMAQIGEEKDSSTKKKGWLRELANSAVSILALILLFKAFTGGFDQLASDLTHGAYGKGSDADEITATTKDGVKVKLVKIPTKKILLLHRMKCRKHWHQMLLRRKALIRQRLKNIYARSIQLRGSEGTTLSACF